MKNRYWKPWFFLFFFNCAAKPLSSHRRAEITIDVLLQQEMPDTISRLPPVIRMIFQGDYRELWGHTLPKNPRVNNNNKKKQNTVHCLTLQYTLCCLLSSENVGQRQSDVLLKGRLTHWLAHCSLHVGFRVKVRNLMIQSARTNTGLLLASATAINIKFLIFISYLQPCLGCKIRRVLQEPDHLHKTLPTFSARLIDRQDMIDSLSSIHMHQAYLLFWSKLNFQFLEAEHLSCRKMHFPVFVFLVDPSIKCFLEMGLLHVTAWVIFIHVALSKSKSFDQDPNLL